MKTTRPPELSPEEWKKMSHTDRMLWEWAAAEVERDIKEGVERRLKAEKKMKKAEKSDKAEDIAAAKKYSKKAEKLQREELNETIREEAERRLVEYLWGDALWVRTPVQSWQCKDPKDWRKITRMAKRRDTKVVITSTRQGGVLTMRTLGGCISKIDDLADGRLQVWFYWQEEQAAVSAPCMPDIDEEDDEWENHVYMMDGGVIDESDPKEWTDGTPMLPRMPCRNVHRERLKEKFPKFYNAMVSRPVGKKEMLSNPKALEAIKKEWRGLHRQYVFDMENVKEMDNVRAEAKGLGVVVHFARVHGLMVEKNEQLPHEDPRRKYKYRVVLLGNQVKD